MDKIDQSHYMKVSPSLSFYFAMTVSRRLGKSQSSLPVSAQLLGLLQGFAFYSPMLWIFSWQESLGRTHRLLPVDRASRAKAHLVHVGKPLQLPRVESGLQICHPKLLSYSSIPDSIHPGLPYRSLRYISATVIGLTCLTDYTMAHQVKSLVYFRNSISQSCHCYL